MAKVTKKDSILYIKHRLMFDKRWQRRALEVLFAQQTRIERDQEISNCRNTVGFSCFDAQKLCHLGKMAGTSRGNTSLRQRHYNILSLYLPKYAGQIFSLMTVEQVVIIHQLITEASIVIKEPRKIKKLRRQKALFVQDEFMFDLGNNFNNGILL